ncbi:MAG: iron-containing alcohol dehydrogenase [Candidatus Altiarchaeales archaeon]|nr:iron-containing alcohol dehydrogenase [Candidatus Altiarchaeales archaeon]MBD3415678.1 iron-containing alcohol dehydrogenase [Candidatus Altiarchaeales archaeon]
MRFTYHLPTKVHFGAGAVEGLEDVVGGRKTLVVAGKSSMRRIGLLDRVLEILADDEVAVFEEVESDPSVETVDEGVKSAEGAEVIVALGGGSPMDAAKAMSVVAGNGGTARDYLRGKVVSKAGPDIIAVPTTSGTGSEVTEVSVLSDHEAKVKNSFRSVHMYPKVALDDPELTRTMPSEVTASTGLDALTHAVEALVSKRSQPICEIVCMESAKIVLENIEDAVEDGDDMEARTNMMYASLLAGIGITHAGAGVAHGLSYSLWRVTGLAHGTACGTLLPHIIRYNLGYDNGRYGKLAVYCGFNKVEDLISRVEEINMRLGLKDRLGGLGVGEDDIASMVDVGMTGSARANPRPVNEEKLASLIRDML